MSAARRSYAVLIKVNDRKIQEVVIDPHYEEKHKESISHENFEYFENEPLVYKGKNYRLIWCLEKDKKYIGVINAFRRD